MKGLLLVVALLAACKAETPQQAVREGRPEQAPLKAVADPHSFSNPGEVRVEHLILDLDVDFAKKQLRGRAGLRIVNPSGAKVLKLDTMGLDIAKVTLQPSGGEAQFTLGAEDRILGRPLEIPVHATTTGVTIEYATGPGAKALQWLEPAMTAGKKQPFLLSQSQPILARSWVPLQDSPQVRFTYEATLRVPPQLMAVMSAENPQVKTRNGVYHFRMPQPIPSYLLAVAVGDLEFRPFDGRSGVYAEPPVVDAAASEFRDTPKMIAAAEAMYGPYRWGRYDLLVLPPSFPFGGMENPRLTFLTPTVIAGDRSLVSLIAHELAHSWSGNLVTNATWNDGWLNEGFTTYFESRITEKLYGRGTSEMLWQLEDAALREEMKTVPPADQSLYVKLEGRDPDEASYVAYQKGALFLRLLEETAGREEWDRFLRAYFDRFAFQSMTTSRFLEYLREAQPGLAEKVNAQAWLYGPGIPANAPLARSEVMAKVEAQSKAFAEGAPVASLQTEGWGTHQWVHFIRSLPNLYPERMESLDARFHFRESGNNEVLSAWLEKSLDTGYKDVYPAVERFLTTQGRRKYVEPIYRKLAASHPAFAKQVYAKARPTYHPMTVATIDQVLGL